MRETLWWLVNFECFYLPVDGREGLSPFFNGDEDKCCDLLWDWKGLGVW